MFLHLCIVSDLCLFKLVGYVVIILYFFLFISNIWDILYFLFDVNCPKFIFKKNIQNSYYWLKLYSKIYINLFEFSLILQIRFNILKFVVIYLNYKKIKKKW